MKIKLEDYINKLEQENKKEKVNKELKEEALHVGVSRKMCKLSISHI